MSSVSRTPWTVSPLRSLIVVTIFFSPLKEMVLASAIFTGTFAYAVATTTVSALSLPLKQSPLASTRN